MKKALIIILVSIALAACSQAGKIGEKNQPYLARVNNAPITVATYKEEFNALPEEVKQSFTAQDTAPFLDEIVKKEILYQEAQKKGLENDKRVTDAVADFKKLFMVKLLLKDVIQNGATVSDDEVKKYYDDNKQNFKINAPGQPGNGQVVGFDALKDLIRQRLTLKKQEVAVNEYVDGLKKTSKIEINQDELKKLNTGSLSNSLNK